MAPPGPKTTASAAIGSASRRKLAIIIQEGYNIFILNPKPFSKGVNYGYRKGFSESEINLLRENKTLQARILQSKSDNKLFLADIEKGVNRKPLYENHPLSSFSWASTDSMDMCFTHLVQGDWSKKCKEALSKFEMLKEGKSKDDIVYDKAVQILHGPKDEMHDVLENALKSSGFKGLHAECLTDIWVGRERFAFVDLSAGPFAWGPSVGGDGVRTELSLPNVAKTVGAVAEVTEEEAEEKLQDTIRERFSFGEDYHAVDILLAEIDVYELFAFKHCVGRRVQLALCKGTFWLSLSEEPAFMMAFSMARRAAAVPLLLVNGTYKSTVNTYLDSAILQHQLQKLSEHNSLRGILYILLCAFKFYRVEDNWL
nr:unnamed protein product [Digitaria exilis]